MLRRLAIKVRNQHPYIYVSLQAEVAIVRKHVHVYATHDCALHVDNPPLVGLSVSSKRADPITDRKEASRHDCEAGQDLC